MKLPKNKLIHSLTSLGLFTAALTVPIPVHARITNPVIGELGSGEEGATLALILANLWQSAVIVGGIAFILYFVWGALSWMTAESDKAKFESGREKMQNAIIGLVLLAASFAIVKTLGLLLDIEFLKTLKFKFPGA